MVEQHRMKSSPLLCRCLADLFFLIVIHHGCFKKSRAIYYLYPELDQTKPSPVKHDITQLNPVKPLLPRPKKHEEYG